MKKTAGTLAALAFAVFSLPVLAQDEPDATTVLARVGETEITLGHAIALRAALPQQFATVADETLFPALVDQLIEQELLFQHYADTLSRRDRIMLDNETRNFIANAALMAAAEAATTDENLELAYEAFITELGQGEPTTEYNAAHILVPTEEEIQAIVTELEAGGDFAELAREHSIDGSGAAGGDLDWFGEGVMIEPFEQAVMALEAGEVSDPVETRFGWHLILLKETRVATAPTMAMVQGELAAQIQREASRALIERLREGTDIDNRSDAVDPALLQRGELLDE